MSPAVTVIVPAYNRARLIGETLECLLRQTLPPHELFVVDDGSMDDTVAVVREFGNRVRLIEQANAGPGAARNAGLAQASGEYVQFFDSDDLCTLDKLETQAAALSASGADIAYSAWTQAWFVGDEVRIGELLYQQRPVPRGELSAYLRGWVLFMPNCLIRRELLTRVGGYPTASRTGEDLELLLRLILAGARFVHAPGPVLLVRQHPETQISASSELALMRARDRVHLNAQEAALLEGVNAKALDRLLWRAGAWEARRQLASLHSTALPGPTTWLYPALLRARRFARSARARLGGSALGPLFAPGRASASQLEAIEALGYPSVAQRRN